MPPDAHHLVDGPSELQLSPAGFVAFARMTGPDHVVEHANRAWWVLFPGRPAGVPFRDVAPDRADMGALSRLDKVYREGVPLYDNQQVFDVPGRGRLLLDVRLEPRLEDGRVAGVDAFAVDVTAATRNIRLLHEQSILLEAVATSGPLADVLGGMVDVIEDHSQDGVLASILLLDDDGHLRHGAAPSLPEFYNEAIDGIAIGPAVGSCGTAAYRRQPVIVTDVMADPLWADFRELAGRAGLRACWSSPIMSTDGQVLGTFAMYYRAPKEPTDNDLAASAMFARTAALAIERNRLDRARLAAQSDLRFLLEASSAVGAPSGGTGSVERLARLVVPRLCRVCAIDVRDGTGRRRLAVAVHDGPPEAEARLMDPQLQLGPEHPVTQVLSGIGSPVTVRGDDIVERSSGDHRRLLEDLGAGSYATIPLAVRGEAFGALTMMETGGRSLGDHSVALAEDLAGRVAQTLDTIRQFDQRVALVRDLQTELLPPRLPDIAGMDLSVSYHPGAEGLEVGGDFYDVFKLPGGRWAAMVGDVSGRGARAAGATALARFTTRAVAPLIDGAAPTLSAVNNALLAIEDPERFITAVYVELDPRPGGALDAELVSAGHPAPLVRRADGRVESVDVTGPILGQFSDVAYRSRAVTLGPGDCLVLVTDGVLEARGRGRELFGEERLRAAVAGAPAGGRAVVEAVDAAVVAFSGGSLDDDRAVFVLCASGS